MREAARIILADIGAHALAIGTGGYDTHSGQNTSVTTSSFGVQNQTLPYHEYLLKNVAESVKALYDDLAAHGASGRVVIVTFSEFGRTVYENTDGGTDHGFGSCAFVVGDVVNGQNVYGTYPSLLNLYQGDSLKISNDFRNVYATILANFFGADPGLVDTNDGSYSPAPIAYI
jgi:uncharacterized protein (DUF1501 family)